MVGANNESGEGRGIRSGAEEPEEPSGVRVIRFARPSTRREFRRRRGRTRRPILYGKRGVVVITPSSTLGLIAKYGRLAGPVFPCLDPPLGRSPLNDATSDRRTGTPPRRTTLPIGTGALGAPTRASAGGPAARKERAAQEERYAYPTAYGGPGCRTHRS